MVGITKSGLFTSFWPRVSAVGMSREFCESVCKGKSCARYEALEGESSHLNC